MVGELPFALCLIPKLFANSMPTADAFLLQQVEKDELPLFFYPTWVYNLGTAQIFAIVLMRFYAYSRLLALIPLCPHIYNGGFALNPPSLTQPGDNSMGSI